MKWSRQDAALVGALALVAALLRLPLAAAQSLWYDEWATWALMQGSFTEMLRGVIETEGSPAVFYVAEWLVTRVAGTGDLAVRLVPLACAVALVPVGFLLGRRLAGRGAGFGLAGAMAVHPWLVWLGAEARVYTLYALLAALLALAFVRVLERPGPERLAAWGLLGALLATTHYFAVLLVAGQGAWLFVTQPAVRRGLLFVAGAVSAVGLAVAPVWAAQLDNTEFFRDFGDAERVEGVVRAALVGASPPTWHLALPAGALAVVALVAFAAGWRRADRRVSWQLAGSVTIAGLLTLVAAFDYLIARNVIGLWVVALALLVAGLAAGPRWLGLPMAVGAALVWGLATGALLLDERLHKADWDRAAELAGPPRPGLVVIAPGAFQAFPLGIYLETPAVGQATASEVVALGARPPAGRSSCGGPRCGLPRADATDPGLAGVDLVGRREEGMWMLARYRADPPIELDYATAERFLPGSGEPAIYAHGPQP
jgi:hypothetical protein